MPGKLQHRRLWLVAFFLGMAFTALAYRLVDLQVLRHEELRAESAKDTQRAFSLKPRRGDIRDIRGNLLATSIPVKNVAADPSFLHGRHEEVARILAPFLEMNEAELAALMEPKVRLDQKGKATAIRFVLLKKNVPVETWQQLQGKIVQTYAVPKGKKIARAELAIRDHLRAAITAGDGQYRVYPNHQLAAHVLGFVGTDEQTPEGRCIVSPGREGIELTLNGPLSGARGWRVTEVDGGKREVVAFREQDVAPRAGLNVVLSVDLRLQQIVEEELTEAMRKHTPISASAIVIRPRTGEILALATMPNFDPNRLGDSKPEHRRNRVICDIAEPGSTFKIVVVAGALNDGIVRLSDTFDCENGKFFYAGRTLHDSHSGYGVLTVQSIIAKSSNIGASKIGIKMGDGRLYDYIRAFGFGQPTGIPLVGERSGIVHPLKNWTKVSITSIPMGQEIAVTPLQMVMAMCAIANDGWLVRPRLVNRLVDENNEVVFQAEPEKIRQVISAEAARQMITALKAVVSADGTAPKAKLDYYSVAGKTGTAQKAVAGRYSHDQFFSSFIGFFPAASPEVRILVVSDEPSGRHYGGQSAAPVFKTIAERAASHLKIRPDIQPAVKTESLAQANSAAPRRAALEPGL